MKTVLLATLTIAVLLGGCTGKTANTNTASNAEASPSESPSPSTAPSAAAALTAAAAPTAAALASAAPVSSGSPNPLAQVHFSDIAGIPAENAIEQEAALGIFGTKSGQFRPDDHVTRAQYIEWLITANNIYFKGNEKAQIRLANSSADQTFVDVPKNYAGFPQIEGMADSGYVIGVDKNHFAPNRLLTREELVAIQTARYMGGGNIATDPKKGIEQWYCGSFTDKDQVSKPYWGAFNTDQCTGFSGQDDTHRIFGSVRTLHPQRPVTRAEVAIALQRIASTSAAQALGLPQ